ncbi:hypothetical protein [Streptococcus hyointestinalis]|uniref:hypothetical protein n=1 Tax=Streptococcus hyointestinalis TaxID=1337 RepID=UPI003D08FB8A
MNVTSSQRVAKVLSLSAILTALGILIPLVMPAKIVIGPASYTLASHVPILLAMFISPFFALMVTLGTTLGFLIAGFPIVIVLRALSHVIFAVVGAYWLQKKPALWDSLTAMLGFALVLNVLHAIGEVVVVYMMTAGTGATANYWFMLNVLIGIGTIIHGMVDFAIAYWLWKQLGLKALVTD